MPPLSLLIAAACALLGLAGAIYFALTIWIVTHYAPHNRSRPDHPFTPPVTILKSLKGLDPYMYAAFRSHCLLDYPEYEVLFGVHDLDETALLLVERLKKEFPERQLRVLHCPEMLGLNGKVSTLAQMLPQAQYEHIIINDSDILVAPDYLQRVLAPLAASDVGMVTTLYRALPSCTLGSRLEALGVNTDFGGGVLVARALEGDIRFGLGATMATTKSVLRQIGGLEPLVDYLGDDYELGARIAAAGHRIELADTVVETALPDYGFRDFWLHQMRWARNVKDRRPAQYIGLLVTFGLPWALIAVIANPLSWWTWLVFAVTVCARFASAIVVARQAAKDTQVFRDLWLLPLRDFIALAVWIVSYMGNTVEWRGLRFRLHKGKLEKL